MLSLRHINGLNVTMIPIAMLSPRRGAINRAGAWMVATARR
jgi:hypothetical protein